MYLCVFIVLGFVDLDVVFDCRLCCDVICLVFDVFVVINGQEFGSIVEEFVNEGVILGLDCYVGDGVIFIGDEFVCCECVIQYVQLVFDFYCIVIDWVFEFFWCIGIEVIEVVIQEGCRIYLLEQLVYDFCLFWF